MRPANGLRYDVLRRERTPKFRAAKNLVRNPVWWDFGEIVRLSGGSHVGAFVGLLGVDDALVLSYTPSPKHGLAGEVKVLQCSGVFFTC
jgi:hypothetical protein